jgi:hypothetical protein
VKIDESFRSMWRWIAVAGVLLACTVVFIAMATRTPQPQSSVRAQPPIPPLPPKLSAAAPQPTTSAPSDPAPPPATAVVDELCGVSGPERIRQGDETLEQHAARLVQSAISRWQTTLATSEDPRRQAIALALTNALPGVRPVDPDEFIPGNEPSKDTPVNNNLVLLATQSGDPAVYSLAMGQCRNFLTGEMGSGSCQALSWEGWASLDPDNVLPWLWIATRAEQAQDPQGVESALSKAASASRIESYASTLGALALDSLPGNATPLEEAVAGADVISMMPVGAPLGVASLCSETAIQQPLRKQQCAAIATILAKPGTSLMDLALASHLADRLGFAQDVRAALVAERKTATAGLAMSHHPWSDTDGVSRFRCANLAIFDQYIDSLRAARGNERAALSAFAVAGRSNRTP